MKLHYSLYICITMAPGSLFIIYISTYYRVLRRIFGPKREEVTREWRKLHNEELHDQYSLPNIMQVIKCIRMGWAGNVARMGRRQA
jgi:hypothetical protein